MNKPKLRPIMLGGTGSDVGKSVLAAGLCRIFRQDGYRPAPFKAQNMALNSFVTADGLEIGRAQAVQAEAAGVECRAEMNPILLKPIGDSTSQVVMMGRPVGNRSAREYFDKAGRRRLAEVAHSAFDRLAAEFNPIVMEGAGSIAEVNLMDLDIVNMPMAQYAGAAVLLVADIRRGGVFASAYGSIVLQKPDYRRLIKGVIVNQFRGDIGLFDDGRRELERLCGVPVVGVMPYLDGLRIEEEDSYFSKKKAHEDVDGKKRIAIVQLSHIANFTDFDPLECDDRASVFYTAEPEEIRASDIVILPGSKATIADLDELRRNGAAQAIIDARQAGKTVIGICGGYQMMGRELHDPDGIEGGKKHTRGLGLLPTETTITSEKLTRRVMFRFRDCGSPCSGYEIHMGQTTLHDGTPVVTLDDGCVDGCHVDDRCFGTYIHGLFDNRCVIDSLLGATSDFDYRRFRNEQYDRLAAEMRKHLDIDLIYKIMSEHD